MQKNTNNKNNSPLTVYKMPCARRMSWKHAKDCKSARKAGVRAVHSVAALCSRYKTWMGFCKWTSLVSSWVPQSSVFARHWLILSVSQVNNQWLVEAYELCRRCALTNQSSRWSYFYEWLGFIHIHIQLVVFSPLPRHRRLKRHTQKIQITGKINLSVLSRHVLKNTSNFEKVWRYTDWRSNRVK